MSTPPPLAFGRSLRYKLYALFSVNSLLSMRDVNQVSVPMIMSGLQEAVMYSNSSCLESKLRKFTTKKDNVGLTEG